MQSCPLMRGHEVDHAGKEAGGLDQGAENGIESGVCSAAFKTTVLSQARAGPSSQQAVDRE